MTACYAQGQQAATSILFRQNRCENTSVGAKVLGDHIDGYDTKGGAKATWGLGGMRWYIYAYLMQDALGLGNYSYAAPFMWWSDSAQAYYNTGTARINIGSIGDILQPTVPAFNDVTVFSWDIAISNIDAYTIDSVFLAGYYMRNFSTPAKMAVKDTLRFRLVYGNGSNTTNILKYYSADTAYVAEYGLPAGRDTIDYWVMAHDSLTNIATNAPGVSGGISAPFDVILSNLDTGELFRTIRVPIPFPVPASMSVGLSVTFKSGDSMAYPGGSAAFHDTVFNSALQYNYGVFRPFYLGKMTGSAAAFPEYTGYPTATVRDRNAGNVRFVPSPGDPVYASMYTSLKIDTLMQYPYIGFHAICATCYPMIPLGKLKEINNIDNFNITPNPANDELNISFDGGNSIATVTLTNMMGQTVAMQKTESGTVVFNTSQLPAGIYIYMIEVNGARVTGRVVVEH